MEIVLHVGDSGPVSDQRDEAIGRVMEILRERMIQFGVRRAWIEREGEDRIIVLLPGATDKDRGVALFGRSAQLDFRLVSELDQYSAVVEELDKTLQGVEIEADDAAVDSSFTSNLRGFTQNAILVEEDRKEIVDLFLARSEAQAVIPSELTFLWGATAKRMGDGGFGRELYLTEKNPLLTGPHIVEASAESFPDYPDAHHVEFELDAEGAAVFSRLTSENIGRHIAIVLDGSVFAAPVVESRVRGGKGRITGSYTIEDARDLAIVLEAGVLPVPVKPHALAYSHPTPEMNPEAFEFAGPSAAESRPQRSILAMMPLGGIDWDTIQVTPLRPWH